jgi:predicted XRE-type DNA-binding protein
MTCKTWPIAWIKAARKDFKEFPSGARQDLAQALTIVAGGGHPDIAKPLTGIGFRRAGAGVEASRGCLQTTKGGSAMSDDFELVRGSGNVFRDFDMPNPDLEQLRAILAAQIIKALDRKRLTVRKAAELTGIAAADFSRIRNANIGRFTVDRLMTVLGRLDQRVDVNVKVRPNVKRAIPVPSQ